MPGQCRSLPRDAILDDHELTEIKTAVLEIPFTQGEKWVVVTESKDLDMRLGTSFGGLLRAGLITLASYRPRRVGESCSHGHSIRRNVSEIRERRDCGEGPASLDDQPDGVRLQLGDPTGSE